MSPITNLRARPRSASKSATSSAVAWRRLARRAVELAELDLGVACKRAIRALARGFREAGRARTCKDSPMSAMSQSPPREAAAEHSGGAPLERRARAAARRPRRPVRVSQSEWQDELEVIETEMTQVEVDRLFEALRAAAD
jgi:hypothetical protein